MATHQLPSPARPRRRRLTGAALIVAAVAACGMAGAAFRAAGPAKAQITDLSLASEKPIRGVVELFTSQGCSSCPPADALLGQYADSREVIALSFPVDYWDYLGWKDTLANPRFTARQRAYAKARGDGAIYTPQIVVDGTTHVVGSQKGEIDKAIEANWPKFSTARVPVRFWLQGGAIIVETGAAPELPPREAGASEGAGDAAPSKPAPKEATIWLAVITRKAEVPVRAGENKGKSLVYTNVVREIVPIGMWRGKPMNVRIARHSVLKPETEAFAVLIQQGDGGPIIGAAWMGP